LKRKNCYHCFTAASKARGGLWKVRHPNDGVQPGYQIKPAILKARKHMEMENEHSEKLFDLKQMEDIADGNREFLTAMSKIYIDNSPATSTMLVEATAAAEWDKVSKLAHKLKSTIDSLNMHSIRGDIRSIEMDAKNKVNTDGLKLLALKVDRVIKAVAEQLKADFPM
jgi:HPt (histidine-containing phosphotransfer) domain-containing protein